ncbi:MAG: hypothetical protein KC613_05325 [Myxococcales bacterium]|nr:hypothetical protein [Myxococcales bacterium]MCB9522084.1 hypothetical protein [Myxococcales bacterium]
MADRRRWLVIAGAVVGTLAVLGISGGMAFRATGPSTGGQLVFQDDFERGELGDAWLQGAPDQGWKKGTWVIEGGRLKAEQIHNAALWLQRPLPARVRIEFDARALSDTGDVKAEAFGDGLTHQSGYIFIHGGWHNRVNAIARQDEHGEDRKEDNRCGQPQARCVEKDVDYHWVIERTGATVRWYLDGKLFLTYPDDHPVQGRHFAFNNWEAPVSFDNLAVYDLGP